MTSVRVDSAARVAAGTRVAKATEIRTWSMTINTIDNSTARHEPQRDEPSVRPPLAAEAGEAQPSRPAIVDHATTLRWFAVLFLLLALLLAFLPDVR
jgi:hypothetical protein